MADEAYFNSMEFDPEAELEKNDISRNQSNDLNGSFDSLSDSSDDNSINLDYLPNKKNHIDYHFINSASDKIWQD